MSPAIHVGTDKETVIAARAAILAILKSGHDERTIRLALEVFEKICDVRNTMITGNVIHIPPPDKNEPQP